MDKKYDTENLLKLYDDFMKRNPDKPLNKEQLKAYIMRYNGYAVATDTHTMPTKGINSGAHGRLFELLIKLALHNYRFKGVTNSGRKDTTKKIEDKKYSFEIKQGAGELITYNAFDEVASDVRESDFIIYSPCYFPIATDNIKTAIVNAVKQAYIMDAVEFYNLLEENNLLRTKKSTFWYSECYFGTMDYDRITIKSFNNSAKMEDKIYTLMEENAMPFEAWLQETGLW